MKKTRRTRVQNIGRISLLYLFPGVVLFLTYLAIDLKGSIDPLFDQLSQQGFVETFSVVFLQVAGGTPKAWAIILIFGGIQLILMRILPGRRFRGPAADGPEYRNNGLMAFVVTIGLWIVAVYMLHLFPATIIYDNLRGIIGALNIFTQILCNITNFKGRFRSSNPDRLISSNPLHDFFRGIERYPLVMRVNVKHWITCRFGMMLWPIIVLSAWDSQRMFSGFNWAMTSCVLLQMMYIARFFLWERGFLHSSDIVHKRMGFYLCWNYLVWIPGFYTLPAVYLVYNAPGITAGAGILFFIAGAAAIILLYSIDRQRLVFRDMRGSSQVFGKAPRIIHAPLAVHGTQTMHGDVGNETQNPLLLASGWWGMARHLHYTVGIFAAFFWTIPALFTNVIPYLYLLFLVGFFVYRTAVNERRCRKRYGDAWHEYCRLVPSRMLPGIYVSKK
ncbi:MAG: hypothetical protein ACR2PY_09125 [Salinispira sp.]